MQVFQEPALASAVGEANERMIVAALLERLLDAAVPRMEEGPQLVKALNVLMLKVLEHCPRTLVQARCCACSRRRLSPWRMTRRPRRDSTSSS